MSKIINQISVFISNSPGSLAALSEKLKACNVNMLPFNLSENSEFGIVRIIVKDSAPAIEALKKAGLTVRATEVLGVRIQDTPGAFVPAAEALGKAGINIRYAYAFTLVGGDAVLFIRVDEPEKAVDVLEKAGIRLETESDL